MTHRLRISSLSSKPLIQSLLKYALTGYKLLIPHLPHSSLPPHILMAALRRKSHPWYRTKPPSGVRDFSDSDDRHLQPLQHIFR